MKQNNLKQNNMKQNNMKQNKNLRIALIYIAVMVFGSAYYPAFAEKDGGDTLLPGYISASHAGGEDALKPNDSFIYRFADKVIEREEYEERKRLEAEEARRRAEEEKRLNEMQRRIASLTNDEIDEVYSHDYFVERLKNLGYYKQDFSDEYLNYRNAVIRMQAAMNFKVDAALGELSKKALVENSPVFTVDEIESPASSGFWITINKSRNILTVYQGSETYHKYPVATGASMSLTPEGKFKIVTKSVNPAWGGGGYASPVAGGVPSNPLGKRWLGLSVGGGGSYGVHGNASPTSIGTYASHGCVRMINTDVESMYDYIPIGTPVWIGTDDKLLSFGVRQSYRIEAPIEPEDEPEVAEDPEAGSDRTISEQGESGSDADSDGSGRATPLPLFEDDDDKG